MDTSLHDLIVSAIGVKPIELLIIILLSMILMAVILSYIQHIKGANVGVNGDSRLPRAQQALNPLDLNRNPRTAPDADIHPISNMNIQCPKCDFIGIGNMVGSIPYVAKDRVVGPKHDWEAIKDVSGFYPNDNKKDFSTELNEAIAKYNAKKLVTKDNNHNLYPDCIYPNERCRDSSDWFKDIIDKIKATSDSSDPRGALLIKRITSCIGVGDDGVINKYIDKLLKTNVNENR